MEQGIPAAKLQFHGARSQPRSYRRGIPVFVRAGQEGRGRGQMAVIKEQRQAADRQSEEHMGRCTGQEVFEQGAAVFTEVDGVYAHYR